MQFGISGRKLDTTRSRGICRGCVANSCRVAKLVLEREHPLPVILHADDGPSLCLCGLVERRAEGSDPAIGQSVCRTVSVFARRIIVQHEKSHPWTFTTGGVFKH